MPVPGHPPGGGPAWAGGRWPPPPACSPKAVGFASGPIGVAARGAGAAPGICRRNMPAGLQPPFSVPPAPDCGFPFHAPPDTGTCAPGPRACRGGGKTRGLPGCSGRRQGHSWPVNPPVRGRTGPRADPRNLGPGLAVSPLLPGVPRRPTGPPLARKPAGAGDAGLHVPGLPPGTAASRPRFLAFSPSPGTGAAASGGRSRYGEEPCPPVAPGVSLPGLDGRARPLQSVPGYPPDGGGFAAGSRHRPGRGKPSPSCWPPRSTLIRDTARGPPVKRGLRLLDGSL